MHFFTSSGFVWYVTENVFSLVELIKLKLFLINILLWKSVTAMDLHCRLAIAVLVLFLVLKIQLIQILFNKDNCCWRTELVNIPEVSLLANLKKKVKNFCYLTMTFSDIMGIFTSLVQGAGGTAVALLKAMQCSKGTCQITELNPEKEHRHFCYST